MADHWDLSVDFISVGSGVGGAAGAAAAADAGMEALIIEKSALLGGSSTYSYGILWVPNNHLERAEGVADSYADALAYMRYLGAGREWQEHVESYLRHAPVALEYFANLGAIPFYLVDGLPDHYHPAAPGSRAHGRNIQVQPFPTSRLGPFQSKLRHSIYVERATFEEMAKWGGRGNEEGWDVQVIAHREAEDLRTFGAGLAAAFLATAHDKGVKIMPETGATSLIVEDGEVRGLEAEQNGQTLRIEARKGVLIATGLYGGNGRLVSWLDEYPPHPSQRPAASSQGDGHVLAMEHGAALHIQHGTLANHLGYHVPGEVQEGYPVGRLASLREVAAPHTVLVNAEGERFADESFFEHIAIRLRDFDLWSHRFVNRPCFLIFDQQFWEKYALSPFKPGSQPPSWLVQGNTVAEVAEKLAVDSSRLVSTLERFNGFVRQGRDEDFHRGEALWVKQVTGDYSRTHDPNLGTVEKPPFFGIELHPTDTRSAGLVIDTEGRVIHLRGHAIPGLYACGEVAAQLHVGVGYQAGYTLTGAMTFGHRAALHARERGKG